MKIIKGFEKAKLALTRQPREDMPEGGHEDAVRKIIRGVRKRGDSALLDYTEKFDGVRLSSLEVDTREIDRAYRELDKRLLAALELAAERITAYHSRQKKELIRESKDSLGWLIRPLQRVGIHVPGFQAPLPSSLLMTAIPARVAGVKEIIVATPPGKSGAVSPVTLAAAKIAGVHGVFSVGGAQAVAALAYGTESVPSVDKVCGPGNIYVSLAKKIVFGDVGIDGLYGPSEVIIIADETANAEYVAADLLAQAEHGSLPAAILLTTSQKLASDVDREIDKQLESLPRQQVITESLEGRGLITILSTINEALELANIYAPEHLCLVVKDAANYIDKVQNAGCLFVGEHAVEVLVDYVSGPSHVLPTDGTARFSSPLNIMDFVKLISLVQTEKEDIWPLAKPTSIIARAEGLDAHARAAEIRLEDKGNEV